MKGTFMQRLFGTIFSFIGLLILMAIFNSGNNTAFSQWPTEAFYGMVFTIGWLSRLPDVAVYIVTILLICSAIVIFNQIGQWVYRKLFIRV